MGKRAAETGDGLWAPARRALVVGLVMTITIIATEALSVITIMPIVAKDLGGLQYYGWAFSAFMLASLLGIVGAGRQADRRGPAKPYTAGLLLFAAGLTVAGAAPSMPVLIVGRALQGLGAGAVPAVAYVAIGRSLPDQLRARMLAVTSTAWVVPSLLGPGLSAAVARSVGWRWVFLGLIPLVAVAGPAALPTLRRLGPVTRQERTDQGGLTPETEDAVHAAQDHRVKDAFLTTIGAALVLAGLGASNVLAGAAAVVIGLPFGLRGLRRLLPPGTLAARAGLPATVLSRGLLTFGYFGCDAFVTLALTTVRHRSATLASIVVTFSTLTWTTGSWVQARLHGRWEARRLIRTGLGVVIACTAGVAAGLSSRVPVEVAMVAWSLAGFGIGMAYSQLSLIVLREAPAGREGWAAASLNLSDVLGTALGVGLGGAAIAAASRSGGSLSVGIVAAWAIAAAGVVTGLVVSRRLPTRLELEPVGAD